MERVGSKLDIQRLSKETGLSRPTLSNYIAFLEGTFFIATIKPFSVGRGTEIRKAPKLYFCDSGLANHFSKLNGSVIFENSVFQNLRLKGALNYYQRKNGREIDFILDKSEAYEVKVRPTEGDLRKLTTLGEDLSLNSVRIVSKDYTELKNAIYGFLL